MTDRPQGPTHIHTWQYIHNLSQKTTHTTLMQTLASSSGIVPYMYAPLAQGGLVPPDFHSHQGYLECRPLHPAQVVLQGRGHPWDLGDRPSGQSRVPMGRDKAGVHNSHIRMQAVHSTMNSIVSFTACRAHLQSFITSDISLLTNHLRMISANKRYNHACHD